MKYSVLMSLYSKEYPEYLKLSIESMINQTIKPDEIIIVKDGKLTDELNQIVDDYKRKNRKLFTIISIENNVGLGRALNEGLKHSRNELVARMDTDDISKPNRCEKQIEIFKSNENLSICGTNIDEFDKDIEIIIGHRNVPESRKDIYYFSRRRSAFNHPTVMYKKSEVLKIGGYSDLRRNQDVDLFGRMMFNGCNAYNIQESLLWFRANDRLMKRRKSWDNSKSYIQTIKKFYKMGYSNYTDYIVVLIGQIVMYICPIKIQKVIYKLFLRRVK